MEGVGASYIVELNGLISSSYWVLEIWQWNLVCFWSLLWLYGALIANGASFWMNARSCNEISGIFHFCVSGGRESSCTSSS
ncbi:hypothetical protein D5086_019169 [Populus alba]|uniref:Uncharacterized protein n=1 Tax=Populus alba TaxID=43335 RepID=A0ACC4BGK4_POPAL